VSLSAVKMRALRARDALSSALRDEVTAARGRRLCMRRGNRVTWELEER
jgi:hypothetical protein